MSTLPDVTPFPPPELQPFWEATGRGVLLVPHCNACGEAFWYPRSFCPFCHSGDLDWRESSGSGAIYSFTVVERAGGPWEAALPYVVAYVELDEGPRLLTNIVDCDPTALTVGQRVSVTFEGAGDYKFPRFRP